MSLETTGKIYKLDKTEQVTDSFKKRQIVLSIEDGPYTQLVAFEFVQDNCAKLDKFAEGQLVTIGFNLRGREWNGKFFTNLNGWRIDYAATDQPKEEFKPKKVTPNAGGKNDDLPF